MKKMLTECSPFDMRDQKRNDNFFLSPLQAEAPMTQRVILARFPRRPHLLIHV